MEEQREETEAGKWVGKARAELIGPQSHQIWSLLSDFCSIHKWFPHVDTCYLVEGMDGEPGLIRYCASTQRSPAPPPPTSDDRHGGDEEVVTRWVKERLIAIDPTEKWFSYDIVESNAGFGSYVATMKVIDGGDDGCVIEWSYEADPVAGWTPEHLLSFVEFTVDAMARRMEEALLQPCNN